MGYPLPFSIQSITDREGGGSGGAVVGTYGMSSNIP